MNDDKSRAGDEAERFIKPRRMGWALRGAQMVYHYYANNLQMDRAAICGKQNTSFSYGTAQPHTTADGCCKTCWRLSGGAR